MSFPANSHSVLTVAMISVLLYPQDSNQGDGCLGEQFANYDAVHVLSYAIMMLNTDLHSSQVKKKMLLSEFIRNQRKTNNGSNFPEAFLTEVYNRIK